MNFLERLIFGRKEEPQARTEAPTAPGGSERPVSDDEQALQRYRYMLRTAPPETIEQAHLEAFAKLTPAQRAQVLRELAAATPERERAALAEDRDDPKSLARLATRVEMRQPGVMERIFGGRGMGTGMGGMMGGSIFGSLVAGFVGSMIAQQFFDSMGDPDYFGESDSGEQTGDDQQAEDSASEDYGDDTGSDYDFGSEQGSGDYWGDDSAGSDWGGGGDWGGADFGGGDW